MYNVKLFLEAATEDQEYVPPKNEFVAVKEEDAFYSKRFVKVALYIYHSIYLKKWVTQWAVVTN